MDHHPTEIYYKWGTTSVAAALAAAREKEIPIFGSSRECAERISEFASAGADVTILQPVFDNLVHAELLAEEVIPLV